VSVELLQLRLIWLLLAALAARLPGVLGAVVSPPPPPPNSEYSRRLGEPEPALLTLFGVAALSSALVTWDTLAVGLSAR
jgi:hypothetical protein